MATFNGSIADELDDGIGTTPFVNDQPGAGGVLAISNFEGIISEAFLRFTGVTIPQGATVSAATVTVKPNSSYDTSGMTFTCVGFDEDNSAQLADETDYLARDRTTAAPTGNFGSTTLDTPVASFDIASVIEEIVGRGGWASGNALQLALSVASGGAFAFYPYADYQCELDVTYTAAGPPPAICGIFRSAIFGGR